MTEKTYGPSRAAQKAAEDAYLKAYPGTTISTTPVTLLRIAHDPALRDDMSVCLGAVIEWIEGGGANLHREDRVAVVTGLRRRFMESANAR